MRRASTLRELGVCVFAALCAGCGTAPVVPPPTIAVPAQASDAPSESWVEPKGSSIEDCFVAWQAAHDARRQLDSAGKITVAEFVVHLRRVNAATRSVEKAAADMRFYDEASQAMEQHDRGLDLLIELGQHVGPEARLMKDRYRLEPLEAPEEEVANMVDEIEDLANSVMDIAHSVSSQVAEFHPDPGTRARASCLVARIDAFLETHEEVVVVRGMIEAGDEVEGAVEGVLVDVREGLRMDAQMSLRAVEAALQAPERGLFYEGLIEVWGNVRESCGGI